MVHLSPHACEHLMVSLLCTAARQLHLPLRHWLAHRVGIEHVPAHRPQTETKVEAAVSHTLCLATITQQNALVYSVLRHLFDNASTDQTPVNRRLEALVGRKREALPQLLLFSQR